MHEALSIGKTTLKGQILDQVDGRLLQMSAYMKDSLSQQVGSLESQTK